MSTRVPVLANRERSPGVGRNHLPGPSSTESIFDHVFRSTTNGVTDCVADDDSFVCCPRTDSIFGRVFGSTACRGTVDSLVRCSSTKSIFDHVFGSTACWHTDGVTSDGVQNFGSETGSSGFLKKK